MNEEQEKKHQCKYVSFRFGTICLECYFQQFKSIPLGKKFNVKEVKLTTSIKF